MPLTRQTEQTLCDLHSLSTELDRTKRQGYGLDNEEFIRGMIAIAVPVRNAQGECVAAVACHSPTARYDLDALMACVGTLKLAAVRIADILESPPRSAPHAVG
jgi:DNA-binding IclR family transcriptional regulator